MDDEQKAKRRAERDALAQERIQARVRELVTDAPLLTEEQKDQIAVLLRPRDQP